MGFLNFGPRTLKAGDFQVQLGDPFYRDPSPGRIYHVDLIAGDDTKDGLTWGRAMAQVNTAITASEVWRLAQTNVYTRPRILIKGAANTAYTGLTAFPNYTDVVGVGGSYLGDMTGTVVIGTDTTKNGSATAEMRGSTFSNIQFRGGGSTNSALLALKVLRTRFYECMFRVGASGDAGVHIYTGGTGAHNVFQSCHVGYGSAGTYGFYINETNNWDHCLIQDCFIVGSTAGYYTNAYLQNQTEVRRCTIVGGVSGLAIDDNSTETNINGNAYYIDNRCHSGGGTTNPATVIEVTNNAAKRCIGNIVTTTTKSYFYFGDTTAL